MAAPDLRAGDREVSLFFRSNRTAPGSHGPLALTGEPSNQRVGELEVVGLRRGVSALRAEQQNHDREAPISPRTCGPRLNSPRLNGDRFILIR